MCLTATIHDYEGYDLAKENKLGKSIMTISNSSLYEKLSPHHRQAIEQIFSRQAADRLARRELSLPS